MAFFSPFQELYRGLKTFTRGVSWLKDHPGYFILLFIPMIIAIMVLGVGWGFFFGYQDQIFDMVLFAKPESLWLAPLYYLCKILLYVALFLLSFLTALLVANIIASPIYEIVSVAVEKELSGGRVEEVSLWSSIKLIGEEIKKALFILGVSILLLFIPGLNVISTFITAFLIGWNFYDYPLARRGLRFRERFRIVLGDFWAVMGLGLWLIIPFAQVVLFPLAVAGGTMLNIESTNAKRRLGANRI